MSHAARKLPVCPNCGTDLTAEPNDFCPRCGQQNHDLNVGFGHVLEETLEGVFHFDSKVWRTFQELLFRPGRLTLHFVEGRRAAFVPPIRLYIFVALVFFFMLSHRRTEEHAGGPVRVREALEKLGTQLDSVETLRTSRGDSSKRGAMASVGIYTATDTGKAFEMGISLRNDQQVADTAQPAGARPGRMRSLSMNLGSQKVSLTSADLHNPALLTRVAEGERAAMDSLLRAQQVPSTWLSRLAIRQLARVANGDLESIGHTLQKNVSVGMFFLMPLFAALLRFAYRRQRPLYVQHLMFSLHLHSFFFLAFALVLMLEWLVPVNNLLSAALWLLTWVYWVLALKNFSGQRLGRTIWKGSVVFACYLMLVVVFAVGVIAVSLLTY